MKNRLKQLYSHYFIKYYQSPKRYKKHRYFGTRDCFMSISTNALVGIHVVKNNEVVMNSFWMETNKVGYGHVAGNLTHKYIFKVLKKLHKKLR